MLLWKKTLSLFAVVLLAVLLPGCGGGEGNTNGPLTSAPRQFGSLRFTLSSDKTIYATGQQATLTFTVKNTGTQTVNAVSPGSQIYQIEVYSGDQKVWFFPGGGAGVTTPVVFAPGETKTFTATWNLDYQSSGNPVLTSQYTVHSYLTINSLDNVSISDISARANLSAVPLQIIVQTR